MEKSYIGKVEAMEFMLDNYLPNLPRKNGKVWLIVQSTASGLSDIEFGKDDNGYYIKTA